MTDEVEKALQELPFDLITHCPICGEPYNLTRYDVRFQLGMGHTLNLELMRATLVDLDETCSQC